MRIFNQKSHTWTNRRNAWGGKLEGWECAECRQVCLDIENLGRPCDFCKNIPCVPLSRPLIPKGN